MKARKLYDVRSVTGEVSGNDLHKMFERLIGDPSPSGKVEIDEDKLSKDDTGFILLMKLKQPLEWTLDDIKEYQDIP